MPLGPIELVIIVGVAAPVVLAAIAAARWLWLSFQGPR